MDMPKSISRQSVAYSTAIFNTYHSVELGKDGAGVQPKGSFSTKVLSTCMIWSGSGHQLASLKWHERHCKDDYDGVWRLVKSISRSSRPFDFVRLYSEYDTHGFNAVISDRHGGFYFSKCTL
jgi:hypothetical protein